MNGAVRKLALGAIGAVVVASPVLAHHEWPVDRTRQVTVTGTVTAYTWADPHVMIALDVPANGREMYLYGRLPVLPAADPAPTGKERRS